MSQSANGRLVHSWQARAEGPFDVHRWSSVAPMTQPARDQRPPPSSTQCPACGADHTEITTHSIALIHLRCPVCGHRWDTAERRRQPAPARVGGEPRLAAALRREQHDVPGQPPGLIAPPLGAQAAGRWHPDRHSSLDSVAIADHDHPFASNVARVSAIAPHSCACSCGRNRRLRIRGPRLEPDSPDTAEVWRGAN